MATVHADLVGTTSLTEEDGVKVDMVREYLVTGLTRADWAVLDEAIDTAGVPTVNTSPNVSGATYNNLKMVARTADQVPGTTDTVRVRCRYIPVGRTSYNFIFRGGTSLNQVQTSVDGWGNAVSTSHTYPGGDVGPPSKASQTDTQGANMTVLAPETTYSAEGITNTDYPDRLTRQWVGWVNSDWWAGDAPGTWLCTHVTFEAHDITQSPKQWKFLFEFQYDGTGWQPSVIHIDERTGKPPANLVAGVGVKTVAWYPSKIYGLTFPI